jgi:DNA replication protein DnaC
VPDPLDRSESGTLSHSRSTVSSQSYPIRSCSSRAAELIRSLEEAQAAGKLVPRLKTLTYPSLLVVDEIGYLPISRTGARLFFQLMSRRYERASTVLTSNKSFEEWGEIFGDEVMAAARIDRLQHHCHIVNVRGNSYRMRNHAGFARSAEPEGPRGSAPTHKG